LSARPHFFPPCQFFFPPLGWGGLSLCFSFFLPFNANPIVFGLSTPCPTRFTPLSKIFPGIFFFRFAFSPYWEGSGESTVCLRFSPCYPWALIVEIYCFFFSPSVSPISVTRSSLCSGHAILCRCRAFFSVFFPPQSGSASPLLRTYRFFDRPLLFCCFIQCSFLRGTLNPPRVALLPGFFFALISRLWIRGVYLSFLFKFPGAWFSAIGLVFPSLKGLPFFHTPFFLFAPSPPTSSKVLGDPQFVIPFFSLCFYVFNPSRTFVISENPVPFPPPQTILLV